MRPNIHPARRDGLDVHTRFALRPQIGEFVRMGVPMYTDRKWQLDDARSRAQGLVARTLIAVGVAAAAVLLVALILVCWQPEPAYAIGMAASSLMAVPAAAVPAKAQAGGWSLISAGLAALGVLSALLFLAAMAAEQVQVADRRSLRVGLPDTVRLATRRTALFGNLFALMGITTALAWVALDDFTLSAVLVNQHTVLVALPFVACALAFVAYNICRARSASEYNKAVTGAISSVYGSHLQDRPPRSKETLINPVIPAQAGIHLYLTCENGFRVRPGMTKPAINQRFSKELPPAAARSYRMQRHRSIL